MTAKLRDMLIFTCITSEYNPCAWDIQDSTGRRYLWGGDLYGALREAARLEAIANERNPNA